MKVSPDAFALVFGDCIGGGCMGLALSLRTALGV
jgi:hypothetical protein